MIQVTEAHPRDGLCKLCGTHARLLKKSHIIPDFLYKGIYDEGHLLHYLDPAKSWAGVEKHRKALPTAPYDAGMLCARCDNEVIGGYETYARLCLFGKDLQPEKSPHIVNVRDPLNGFGETRITNLDYTRFKLFLLSILWRAHHSTQPFFDKVNLNKYEVVLRHHIFSGVAPDELTFPIAFMGWRSTAKLPPDMLAAPIPARFDGHWAYAFFFQGLIAMMFVSKGANTESFTHNILKENGALNILNLSDEAMTAYFGKAFNIKGFQARRPFAPFPVR